MHTHTKGENRDTTFIHHSAFEQTGYPQNSNLIGC